MRAVNCGVARAKQYLMTGDLIGAREAERIGLVNKVVPNGKAYEEAWKFAKRLADGPIQAIQWTKYSVNKLIKDQMNLTLDTSLALEGLTFLTEDHREAAKAFVEKREPVLKRGNRDDRKINGTIGSFFCFRPAIDVRPEKFQSSCKHLGQPD